MKSYSVRRSSDELKRLARDAQDNARAGTPAEAATDADELLLAVHWSRIDDVLKQAGDQWRIKREGARIRTSWPGDPNLLQHHLDSGTQLILSVQK